jgi:hypothetical protein
LQPKHKETYQHFLVLAHPDALALDELYVFESTKHIMMDLELNLDPEGRSLLDGERLVLEGLDCTRRGDIDHDIIATFDF